MQILIQSKKENLENHFQNVKKTENSKNEIIKKYNKEYIKYLKEKNDPKNSSSRNIFLIIENNNIKEINNLIEENIIQELNEKYFKIKDYLLKCGNIAIECNKEETKEILYSFFNMKKFLSN